MLKRIFVHRDKDQTKNFSPVWGKRPFDHMKEFLKAASSTLKGSPSNPFQIAVRQGGKTRKPSVPYLEPSQRSMTELLCENS